jgi:hypothetical protein
VALIIQSLLSLLTHLLRLLRYCSVTFSSRSYKLIMNRDLIVVSRLFVQV